MTRLICASLILLLVGCAHRTAPVAHSGSVADDRPRRTITVDAMRIQSGVDPDLGVGTYHGSDVFEAAYEAYDAGQLDKALRLYRKLLADFPDFEDRVSARWNAALCAEALGDLEGAAAEYQAFARLAAEPLQQADGWLKAAWLLQRAGRYADSQPALEAALSIPGQVQEARWEARILQAMAQAVGGWHEVAESTMDRVRREIRRATLSEGVGHPYESAMVWYHAGALYRLKAEAIRLAEVDDAELLAEQVSRKARLLLEARQHFKRSLQHRVPTWSGASSVALGGVFEDFRQDLLEAPLPEELVADPAAAAVYNDLVAERTQAFLEKAAADYREVLASAGRLQLEPGWVAELRLALRRCEEQLSPPIASTAGSPDPEG